MELMDVNLYHYINNLPEGDYGQWRKKRPILRDVAKGLVYLHEQRPPVVHGDLSPRNILLKIGEDKAPVAKIGDLGVARIIKADTKATRSVLTQFPGSVDFMPPESCSDRPVYSTATDTFSYGCIVLFVTTGKWPTPSVQTEVDPFTFGFPKKYIVYSEVERRQKYLDEMQWEAKRLKKTIKSCLSNDPSGRPTMATVAEEIMLKVIILSIGGRRNKTLTTIKEGSLICNLFSQVEKLTPANTDARISIVVGTQELRSTNTLEDYKIEDFTELYVVVRTMGGGDPTHLYSYFDDCVMGLQCPFHEVFGWDDIYELSQEQRNAYNILCRKFNFSGEVIRAIEDNHEEKHIRLADVLHRIYHKDPSITWQRITETISSSNNNCSIL